ncbi:MAG: class I tRNA ligase family protein, partial [Planctomycetota bacterium]|nr:class I tRNA ligase family protein [Planctomycetota bacterium]
MTNSSTNPSTNPSTTPGAPTAPTAPASKPEKNRYRDTLHLPKTPFPMKASLVQNEPQSVKRWQAMNLYQRVMESRVGREPFSFHCGPPYANGSLHLGHLMNITLKDFVVRSQSMMGKLCPFVPGWDCHGLPIEHKVMTDLVVTKPDGTTDSSKLDKVMNLPDEQRRMAIRRECQKHAEKFIKLQASQMVRLFLTGDFENPYLTMQPAYEAGTLEVLATLLERGLVYRALKPVHWSIANETALADAELEYQDREDVSVYVDFEAADADAVYDAFGLPAASDEDDD